jgi:sensor c-di-GMP phosphodiesterase-like protein
MQATWRYRTILGTICKSHSNTIKNLTLGYPLHKGCSVLPSLSIRRKVDTIAVTVFAAALPFLIVLPIVLHEAQRQVAGEGSIIANVIRHHIENLLRQAQDATQTLTTRLHQSCAEVTPALQRMGALHPYVRSFLLVRQDIAYCSSLYGASHSPLIAISSLEHVQPGLSIVPISGTSVVPNRPAVIVSLGMPNKQAVIAIIDAQYLFDMQAAAARDGAYDIEIVLGPHQLPLLEAGERQRPPQPILAQTQVSTSPQFPVEVRVNAKSNTPHHVLNRMWRGYLAFILLASVLTSYVAYHLYSRRVSVPREIRKGIRSHEFHLAYQPMINLATGRLSGVEALLRWTHPQLGSMRPDLFIAAAEEDGVIGELTRHIFDLAATDLPLLNLPAGSHLSINVCGSNIVEPSFVTDVEKLLNRIKTREHITIVLEVTERHPLSDSPQLHAHMAALRQQGVYWALDDFGTGHSSLSYLERLNTDYLKIDRAFVGAIGTAAVNSVVLDTIIRLAQQLGLAMIAEGIESAAQESYLRAQGVQYGQGYHYARPMPAHEVAAWCRQHQNDTST